VGRKVAPTRAPYGAEVTKAALMQQARKQKISGRSRMSKDELARVVRQ